jgi:hypothetical protein
MKDIDDQGVLADINTIITQGTQPEKHMHIQGQQASQVYLMLGITKGSVGQIACRGD